MSIKAKNRINIHGLFPPPIGGVSVHLQRIKLLLEEQGVPFKIYNHGFAEEKNVVALKKSYLWYLGKVFKTEKDLFHFHQFVYLHFIFYFLKSIFSGSRFMITIHSSRILEYGYIKKQLALFLLKRTRYEKLLVVSKSLATFLEERGISCEFLPAYVPPIGYTTTPIEKGSKKWFLFSMWKVTKTLSEEVYDLPLTLSFLSKISTEYNMLFLVGSEEESETDYLNSLIDEYGVEANVRIMFNKQIIDYVTNCDFILRTNIHDGYGVSLHEAMDLGVPAIATNVCVRPEGTITFDSKNLENLLEVYKFASSISNETLLKERKPSEYHIRLLEIYKQYLK